MAGPDALGPEAGRNGQDPAPGDDQTALPSAAPPTSARVMAVVAIVVAGACGGLIGFGIVDLRVSGEQAEAQASPAAAAVGALIGAVVAALGVAVVAVLVLRAMTEWRRIEGDDEPTRRATPRPGPTRGRS